MPKCQMSSGPYGPVFYLTKVHQSIGNHAFNKVQYKSNVSFCKCFGRILQWKFKMNGTRWQWKCKEKSYSLSVWRHDLRIVMKTKQNDHLCFINVNVHVWEAILDQAS